MLKDQRFESGSIYFFGGVKRTPGANGTKDACIEKEKFRVLCDTPSGAFLNLKRWDANSD